MVAHISRKRDRSGGQRQRLRRMLQEEQLNCQSVLCTWLLSMFAWGHFSVQRVQKISALVMKDLKSAETSETIWNDLETLSKLGTEGLYANKMHTELMGKCKGNLVTLCRSTWCIASTWFPKLRGKASEVRHLAKPLSALWSHFMNKNLETHRQLDLYLRLNIQFENILDDHKDDYALPLAAYTAFMNAAFSMMQLCSSLADHFIQEGIPMFDMTSKAHAVLEIAVLSRHINPRTTWCFREEDMMQKVKFCYKVAFEATTEPFASGRCLPTIGLVYTCFSLSTKIEKVTKNRAWL